MKRSIAFVSVCMCLTFVTSVAVAQAQTFTLDQVLTNMEQAGRNFRSMESSIERTKVTVIVNDQYVDSGKAYFTVSGKETRIKFYFLKPEAQSMLIAQGKVLLRSEE